MQEKPASFIYGKVRQPPELMHYGIKGQKWGVRRFQYENGSYTTEGKERYGRGSESSKNGLTRGFKARGNKDPNARENWKPKDVSKLSDEELRRRNNRLQAEQQYKSATTPEWKKETKQIAKDAMKKIFVATAVTSVAAIATAYLKPARTYLSELAEAKMQKTVDSIKAKRAGLR